VLLHEQLLLAVLLPRDVSRVLLPGGQSVLLWLLKDWIEQTGWERQRPEDLSFVARVPGPWAGLLTHLARAPALLLSFSHPFQHLGTGLPVELGQFQDGLLTLERVAPFQAVAVMLAR